MVFLNTLSSAEAANGGVLHIICSAAARKLKLDLLPGKLNMFEEHLLWGLFVHFNGFFQNSSCRTHNNFARKQNSFSEHINILPGSLEICKIGLKFHKLFCKTHLYLLNRLKFVNYKKNPYRTLPKLPGPKHSENTCLICTVRWLLSHLYSG